MLASPYSNSPSLSLASDISSVISVYSTIPGLPFLLQKTPTFSCGLAFTTDLHATVTPLSIAIPISTGSTIFARQLSTPPTNTHFIPNSFIFCIIPSFTSASYTPPCPSAANFTRPSSPIRIFPSVSIIGSSPWIKKNIFLFFWYPKYLCFSKNSIVCLLFSLLVIINHGIVTPYFCPFSFIESHNSSNNDLCESNPMSYVPFGPSCPNLVPCPPAIVTTASCPSSIAFFPISL